MENMHIQTPEKFEYKNTITRKHIQKKIHTHKNTNNTQKKQCKE